MTFRPGLRSGRSTGVWRDNGTLEAVHAALRAAVRVKAGREPTPSAAILGSPSVRVAENRGTAGASTVVADAAYQGTLEDCAAGELGPWLQIVRSSRGRAPS